MFVYCKPPEVWWLIYFQDYPRNYRQWQPLCPPRLPEMECPGSGEGPPTATNSHQLLLSASLTGLVPPAPLVRILILEAAIILTLVMMEMYTAPPTTTAPPPPHHTWLLSAFISSEENILVVVLFIQHHDSPVQAAYRIHMVSSQYLSANKIRCFHHCISPC